MNRSTRGFGLTSVLFAVLVLFVMALFTASAAPHTYQNVVSEQNASAITDNQGVVIVSYCFLG